METLRILHKKRKLIGGRKIDFLFIPDEEFRILMQGCPQDFVKEHQEGGIALVLVSCPSLTSVAPAGIEFPITLLQEIYANGCAQALR